MNEPDLSWGEPEKEKPMDDITLADFERLCKEAYEIHAKVKALEEEAKGYSGTLAQMQEKIRLYMQKYNKSSYKTQWGTLVCAKKFQVKLPDTEADRQALYAYLREKGHFEHLVSVNHMKLNSYYKQELDAAAESGNIDFTIPGIKEPKVYEYIQMRGAK